MPTQTITRSSTIDGRTLESTASYTATGPIGIDGETVTNGQTDKQINISFVVAAVKSFYIKSDQDITIETNSGSEPADTLTLTANKAYEWTVDDEDEFAFGTDVTAFFVTNASGATATIHCQGVQDLTP